MACQVVSDVKSSRSFQEALGLEDRLNLFKLVKARRVSPILVARILRATPNFLQKNLRGLIEDHFDFTVSWAKQPSEAWINFEKEVNLPPLKVL